MIDAGVAAAAAAVECCMIAHLATRRIKGNLAIKFGLGSCALRFPSLCGARRIQKKTACSRNAKIHQVKPIRGPFSYSQFPNSSYSPTTTKNAKPRFQGDVIAVENV